MVGAVLFSAAVALSLVGCVQGEQDRKTLSETMIQVKPEAVEPADWKPGDPIGYMRSEIPGFAMPPYTGERYEALVPDTLDIQERATLAVNVLTESVDPQADYEMYFSVAMNRNPPLMCHNGSSICQAKFMEALPLMRMVSGSELNLEEVDRRWMESALRNLAPDGTYYYPLGGRPWAVHGPWLEAAGGSEDRIRGKDQIIVPISSGRTLSAMMNYARRGDASLWKKEAERMVDGLVDLAVDQGSYAFFHPSNLYAEKGPTDDLGMSGHPGWSAHAAFVALGLAHVYREIGYEPARTLAGKLLNYVVDVLHYIEPDGSFGPAAQDRKHFHMHTYSLLAMLEYALGTGDDKMLELSRRGFEHGKANGDVLLGYFPENTGDAFIKLYGMQTTELCEVADMIALGLKLSAAGAGDYWDDVDRWIRNIFAEGQLTPAKAVLLERYVSSLPVTPVDHDMLMPDRSLPSGYGTTDRVIERNIGGFAGWTQLNDWGTPGIMHCCTGNGTRTVYYIWDHILTYADGKLHVNLLLNRASPWADVDSHIPYTGQVDVKIKKAVDLAVRIPEWVKPGATRCLVSGTKRALRFEGRYAQVGAVKPRDVVTLTFPIAEHTETVWHPQDFEKQGQKYTLLVKGNTVVAIDPPGRTCPFFQRGHYRDNSTRWRKIERFVSNERL